MANEPLPGAPEADASGAPDPTANASGVATASTEDDAVAARLAEVERERDAHLDQLRRLAAEFDNYKKRMVREREDLVVRAAQRVVVDLLPVLDSLERAVDAFEAHDKEHVQEGVALVHRALETLLHKEGVKPIDPAPGDAFDPHRHEALVAQPTDEQPADTVLHVHQKGFLLGERVIRPARVVVAAPAS